MTSREMEIFQLAMSYCHAYYECNPDIGFGIDMETIAKRVANKLSFKIDKDDIAECCEHIMGS